MIYLTFFYQPQIRTILNFEHKGRLHYQDLSNDNLITNIFLYHHNLFEKSEEKSLSLMMAIFQTNSSDK